MKNACRCYFQLYYEDMCGGVGNLMYLRPPPPKKKNFIAVGLNLQ